MRNTRDHTGAPRAQAGLAHPFMSNRDKPETCHLLQKPPEPQGGPIWAVSAGHRVSLLPQILELVTHPRCCSMEQIRKQNICPFKTEKKVICYHLFLSLSFKMPNVFSAVLPSFLLGTRIPKLHLEPKFRFFGSVKGFK